MCIFMLTLFVIPRPSVFPAAPYLFLITPLSFDIPCLHLVRHSVAVWKALTLFFVLTSACGYTLASPLV